MKAFMLYIYNPDGEAHRYIESSSKCSILSTDFSFVFHITTRFATNDNKNEDFFDYFFASGTPLSKCSYMVQYLKTSVGIS